MEKIILKNKKAIQLFLEKNVDKKRKAISPLIATILLIVVVVAIIGIIVSWGKGFTTDSLSNTTSITDFKVNDATHFIFRPDIKGQTLTFTYSPPSNLKNKEISITGYSLPGSSDIVPLDENISLREGYNGISGINLSSFDIDTRKKDLILITSNNEYITLVNVDLLSYNLPPPKICGGLPYIEYSGSYLCIHPTGSGTSQWGCFGTDTGATSFTDGKSNTDTIFANSCSNSNTAAEICDNLSFGGFDDWYLPAKNQLEGMYDEIDSVVLGDYGGDWASYSSQALWSSTQYDSGQAYGFILGNVVLYEIEKVTNLVVRCVRDH